MEPTAKTSRIIEKRTHPEKPTLDSTEASPEAKALWLELHDVMRNEEAWEIIERHLSQAYMLGAFAQVDVDPVESGNWADKASIQNAAFKLYNEDDFDTLITFVREVADKGRVD